MFFSEAYKNDMNVVWFMSVFSINRATRKHG